MDHVRIELTVLSFKFKRCNHNEHSDVLDNFPLSGRASALRTDGTQCRNLTYLNCYVKAGPTQSGLLRIVLVQTAEKTSRELSSVLHEVSEPGFKLM